MKFLFLSLLFFSTTVFAQKITKIEADYRCDQEGGGVAFKVGSIDTARVWQTDVAGDMLEDEGLELTVTDFKTARCQDCFTFEATLMGIVAVRGVVDSSILTYEAYDEEAESWQTILENVRCTPIQN